METDGDLVRQVLAGTVSAYGPLVRRWAARPWRMSRAGGTHRGRGYRAGRLLRGLRALPTLSDPEKFGPWLMGIATRVCLDWLKSARRSEVSLDGLAAGGAAELLPGTADDETAERHAHLLTEVERLPPLYREAIMHYYYKDCTYQQLAEQLGVSAATINARLTPARALLRDRMMAAQE